jgi:Mg2+-importing ATPase
MNRHSHTNTGNTRPHAAENGGAGRMVRTSRAHLSPLLMEAATSEPPDVLRMMDANPNGLPEAEVEARLARYGRNTIAAERPPAWWRLLLRNFRNPFIVVLTVLLGVSIVTDIVLAEAGEAEYTKVVVLTIMIVVSTFMRFFAEYRSTRAAEQLRKMVRTTATVLRQRAVADAEGGSRLRSEKVEIPMEEVVPGDLVHLSAGDMVPADMRLISAKDLFVSESTLTGEAMPVEKRDVLAGVVEKSVRASGRGTPLEQSNLCFMGTNVISGSGLGVAIATGDRAYFGSIASNILGHRAQTSFDKGVNKVTWVLIRFMLVMVPVIFLINGVMKGDWLEAFLFGIAVAVGLTPEMLPMIVTANLAKGAWTMSRHKCVVKRLNAIQNLGAMDVLCTDKTGTLTQDRIVLERFLDPWGHENPRVLELAYLNSYWQTGLKNLLDRAVLEHAEVKARLRLPADYRKVDEIPFDFQRRRMSVVIQRENEPGHLLICKGAVEEIMRHVSRVEENGRTDKVSDPLRQRVEALSRRMNEDGLRVIAVAYREFEPRPEPYTVADESGLVLVGFVAFLDPPKESAAPALRALRDAGIDVKVITGDNEIVTRRVCKEVGLRVERLVLGSEVEALGDHELAEVAEKTTVFAKVNPLQKARIVRCLQARGHTVGFLGDGINDAAALRDADVGISVDTAADIAKESADIIMLEKSLAVLEDGVLKGREVYGNIIKYIKMTASSNFGNVFSVLVASAFIPFLPMLAVHLLIQNLLYDLSQLSIPWDRMDREFLARPRKWDPTGIARFMVCIGPVSSIFDITTYALMWYVFQANSPEMQSLFQSGWFVEGLLSQTLIVHMIRTQKIPFIQSTASLPVMLTTGLIMAFGIYVPFSPLGAAVGMVPLPLSYFPWLVATLLSYCVLAQVAKVLYIRRFKTWL